MIKLVEDALQDATLGEILGIIFLICHSCLRYFKLNLRYQKLLFRYGF